MQYLRLSLAQNEAALASVRADFFFRNMRSDPEFQQLVIDAGLPPLK